MRSPLEWWRSPPWRRCHSLAGRSITFSRRSPHSFPRPWDKARGAAASQQGRQAGGPQQIACRLGGELGPGDRRRTIGDDGADLVAAQDAVIEEGIGNIAIERLIKMRVSADGGGGLAIARVAEIVAAAQHGCSRAVIYVKRVGARQGALIVADS